MDRCSFHKIKAKINYVEIFASKLSGDKCFSELGLKIDIDYDPSCFP